MPNEKGDFPTQPSVPDALRTPESLKTLPDVGARPLVTGLEEKGLGGISLQEPSLNKKPNKPLILPPHIASRLEAAEAAGFSPQEPFTPNADVLTEAHQRTEPAINPNVKVIKEMEMSMSVETPMGRLLRERSDKVADMVRLGGVDALSSSSAKKALKEIDQRIGDTVQDVLMRIRAERLDLTADPEALESYIWEKFDNRARRDPRLDDDQNAKDALNYFLDRATARAADRDPSLPAEPQPWEWRSPETERRRTGSDFEKVLYRIEDMRRAGILDTDTRLIAEFQKRDDMLVEANEIVFPDGERFFDPVKVDLTDTYFHSRVKVSRDVKLGSDPNLRGMGKLQELEVRRAAAREIGDKSWETQHGFWSHPDRVKYLKKYGGIANYMNLHSTDIITDVVRSRHRYKDEARDPYPSDARGVVKIWDGVARNAGGVIIDVETGKPMVAKDFDDIREIIEEQRRMEPTTNTIGYDTTTPLRFVADDREELLEMIPYMIRKVNLRIDPTQIQGAENKLNTEVEMLINTVSTFPELSKKWIRRIRSAISSEFAKSAAYEASGGVRDGWDAFFHFLKRLAKGTEDKEGLSGADHIVDSLFLDRDGHTMSMLGQLCSRDGVYWRYGLKSVDTPNNTPDKSKNYQWQKNEQKRIVEFEMANRLKPMWKLLGLNEDGTEVPGNWVHPAFNRLKGKLDNLDKRDRDLFSRGGGGEAVVVTLDEEGEHRALTKEESEAIGENKKFLVIVDRSGNVPSRWKEYCEKAMQWQKTGEFSDTENPGRIIFQHPLARALRSQGQRLKGEPPTPTDEMELMYEADDRLGDKWYKKGKRRKVVESLDRARKIARAYMIDSEAALSWHTFPTERAATEASKYLALIGEPAVTTKDSVPYKTLYRAMMQSIINKDRGLPIKDRQLKWHSLLSENWGIDLDLPTMAMWRLGAHDGLRAVLLPKIKEQEPELHGAIEASAKKGFDEKNLLTSWAERERRIGLLLDIVMKAKYGDKSKGDGSYFNQAGHDDRDAGVKDIRNFLKLIYGQSSNTVRLNGLISVFGHMGGNTIGRDAGATKNPGRQLVGMYKCEDEVAYMETGYTGYIENPRDMEDNVGRLEKMQKQQKALTSEADDSPGILVKGPFSGMFQWREVYRDFNIYFHDTKQHSIDHAMHDPMGALADMKESSFASLTKMGGAIAGPLAKFFKGNIDSTFGLNPESRKWLNTFQWMGTSIWMDKSPEFRVPEGPAYALDGNLPLARIFMHTGLLDDGLIMTDNHWDKIMLGTVKTRDGREVVRYQVDDSGGVKDYEEVSHKLPDGKNVILPPEHKFGENIAPEDIVETTMGLLDAFPNDLRAEIIENEWIPMGLNSYFPETLANIPREGDYNREFYEAAMHHVRPRTKVVRPVSGRY